MLKVCLTFLFINIVVYTQVPLDSVSIVRCDSIAAKYSKKKFKSVQDLALNLTEGLKTEEEWVYVFAKWYSLSLVYTPRHYVSSGSVALKKRKVVCQGYSLLAQEYFTTLGMYCKYIVGDSKTSVNEIRKKVKSDEHAWNAIRVGNKMLLFDFTWCASAFSREKNKYIQRFEPAHLFRNGEEFFLMGHFPNDESNLFMDCKSCKKEYQNNPIFHQHALTDSVAKNVQIKKMLFGKVVVKAIEIKPTQILIGYYCQNAKSIVVIHPNDYKVRRNKVLVRSKSFQKSNDAILFVNRNKIKSIKR